MLTRVTAVPIRLNVRHEPRRLVGRIVGPQFVAACTVTSRCTEVGHVTDNERLATRGARGAHMAVAKDRISGLQFPCGCIGWVVRPDAWRVIRDATPRIKQQDVVDHGVKVFTRL